MNKTRACELVRAVNHFSEYSQIGSSLGTCYEDMLYFLENTDYGGNTWECFSPCCQVPRIHMYRFL